MSIRTLTLAFLLCFGLTPQPLDARSFGGSTWAVSYNANSVNGVQGNNLDPNSNFIGGTQIRALVGHYYSNGVTMPSGVTCNSSNPTWVAAKNACAGIFAGDGYWNDLYGPEGPQYPEVIALDTPKGKWYQDLSLTGAFQGSAATGVFAVTNFLYDHVWTTNCSGTAISVDMVLAGTQNATSAKIYARNDSNGTWLLNTVVTAANNQVRSGVNHVDTSTGIDTFIVGEDSQGIFSACLTQPNTLTFGSHELFCLSATGNTCNTPCSPNTTSHCTNLDSDWLGGSTVCTAAGVPNAQCQSCQGGTVFQIIPCDMPSSLRIMALTDVVNGAGVHKLCGTIAFEIWCRTDLGLSNSFWTILGMVPVGSIGAFSESGLRGLTAIPATSGGGQAMLSTTEGVNPFVWNISYSGVFTNEINLKTPYNTFCGGSVFGYRIDAYNKIYPMNNSWLLSGGISDIPASTTGSTGTSKCPTINWASVPAQAMNQFDAQRAGLWIRSNNASPTYTFIQVPPIFPQYTVSAYDVIPSPFPSDAINNCGYIGGMDNSGTQLHNTAWIARFCGLAIP